MRPVKVAEKGKEMSKFALEYSAERENRWFEDLRFPFIWSSIIGQTSSLTSPSEFCGDYCEVEALSSSKTAKEEDRWPGEIRTL